LGWILSLQAKIPKIQLVSKKKHEEMSKTYDVEHQLGSLFVVVVSIIVD
jgi:hypothetical protein